MTMTLTGGVGTLIQTLSSPSWITEAVDAMQKADANVPLVLQDDPIALSVASHRLWRDDIYTQRWRPLDACTATDEDFSVADAIREYYGNKIAMWTLKGKTMTSWQRDLYDMILNRSYTKRNLSMIYKLPYFYYADTKVEKLIADYTKQPVDTDLSRLQQRHIISLTPVTKIFHTKRGAELQQYWFKNYRDELVVWEVTDKNNLRGLLDSLFDTNREMIFDSFIRIANHRWPDFTHWKLTGTPRFERFA